MTLQEFVTSTLNQIKSGIDESENHGDKLIEIEFDISIEPREIQGAERIITVDSGNSGAASTNRIKFTVPINFE